MRCTKNNGKCSQKCIRLERVEEQIASVLASIEIDADFMGYCFDVLTRDRVENTQDHIKAQEHLQKQRNENEIKILSLTEKYTMEKIDESIYQQLLSQYKKVRVDLDCQIGTISSYRDTSLEEFFTDMKLAQKVAEEFRNGDVEKKKSIISNLQSNLWLINGNVLIDLKSSFAVLSQCNRLKTVIEPQKSRSHKGGSGLCKNNSYDGAPSEHLIELMKVYLKVRRCYASLIL